MQKTQTKQILAYALAIVILIPVVIAWTKLVTFYNAQGEPELTVQLQSSVLTVETPVARETQTFTLKPQIESVEQSAPAVVEEAPPVTSSSEVVMPELQNWEISYAYGLSIPSLDIAAPVYLPSRSHWNAKQWDLLEDQMQVGLRHGVVAYPHSARPSRRGALILAGHSSPPDALSAQSTYGDLFARLPEITPGEEIVVNDGSADVRYRVKDTYVVHPSETSLLRQDRTQSLLKLITCYPVGSTEKRFIVEAEPITESALTAVVH